LGLLVINGYGECTVMAASIGEPAAQADWLCMQWLPATVLHQLDDLSELSHCHG